MNVMMSVVSSTLYWQYYNLIYHSTCPRNNDIIVRNLGSH